MFRMVDLIQIVITVPAANYTPLEAIVRLLEHSIVYFYCPHEVNPYNKSSILNSSDNLLRIFRGSQTLDKI
jgi:hypothetical protein